MEFEELKKQHICFNCAFDSAALSMIHGAEKFISCLLKYKPIRRRNAVTTGKHLNAKRVLETPPEGSLIQIWDNCGLRIH